MRLPWVALVVLAVAGCARPASSPALVEYTDPSGTVILHPSGWDARPRGGAVWLVPPDTPPDAEPAEFIVVAVRPLNGPANDTVIRQEVFGLLPIFGVSGFQPNPRGQGPGVWYKFEVTGGTGDRQWAAVGAVAAGRTRLVITACAAPLDRWRDGQKRCDTVVRSLRPGPLD